MIHVGRFALFNGNHASKEFELFSKAWLNTDSTGKKIASLVGTRAPVQTRSKYRWLIQENEKEKV